jgi:hypothetical protein
MRILIACEESQAVAIEMRKHGHEAYSCDIQECSGGHPEWHIKGNVLDVINGMYYCKCGNIFEESYGKYGCCGVSTLKQWDAMIAFPPCTHLAITGRSHFKQKQKDGRQQQGIDFFMAMVNAPIKHIAVENPIGIMSTKYKKPTQIIQPYYFGDKAKKSTCLWLKNLPLLVHTDKDNLFEKKTHCDKGDMVVTKTGMVISKWFAETSSIPVSERAKLRSKTFNGIAIAMGEQWGLYLNNLEQIKRAKAKKY